MFDWLIVGVVTSVLVGTSVAFGLFNSPYDVGSAYSGPPSTAAVTQPVSAQVSFTEAQSAPPARAERRGIVRVANDYLPILVALVPLFFFVAAYCVEYTRRRA